MQKSDISPTRYLYIHITYTYTWRWSYESPRGNSCVKCEDARGYFFVCTGKPKPEYLGVIFNALLRIYDILHGRHSRDVHASCHASLWRSIAESEHLRLSEYQSESRSSRNNSSSNDVRLVPCLRRVFIVA